VTTDAEGKPKYEFTNAQGQKELLDPEYISSIVLEEASE